MARSQPGLFRDQAHACARLGSPMYDELLRCLADDLEAAGPTARVLRGHENDPGPSGLSLRLAGGVHRLVLAGAAPELAPYYPSVGGAWSREGATAVLDLIDRRGDELLPWLERAPQTNEVGRSAALLGGLLLLVDRWPLPVRLFEVGASGGLNLLADRFCYTDDAGRRWGDCRSPVLLGHAWSGERLCLDAPLHIAERAGCDISPVDVTTEDGRLTLTSYVWPDMGDRHARLAGAIALARQDQVAVLGADAASYLDGLEVVEGHLTVVWHSVMWQYVPTEQQERITARLAGLGATASDRAPLVHLFAEPTRRTADQRHRFWVVAEAWPGDAERRFLGHMAPHGLPVSWE